MYKPYKVWNAAHQFGDVVIAEFSSLEDAELFVRIKAKREGGFVTTLSVGTTWETRKPVFPVD